MSYQISFTPDANDDFTESTAWYRKQRKGLDARFYHAASKSIAILAETPFVFAVRYKGVRAATVKSFPFSIFYIVEETKQLVVIIAILHNARHPAIWQNRV